MRFPRFCSILASLHFIYYCQYWSLEKLLFNKEKMLDITDNAVTFYHHQVSACIPFLRLLCRPSCRVLFYCHFPDMLLTQRKSFFKKLYRFPLDWLEEYTTGMHTFFFIVFYIFINDSLLFSSSELLSMSVLPSSHKIYREVF